MLSAAVELPRVFEPKVAPATAPYGTLELSTGQIVISRVIVFGKRTEHDAV